MLLKGKNAIITGCNRGIGKAMLEEFASQGANIWACVRNNSQEFIEFCAKVSEKNFVEITPVFLDLNSQEEIKQAVKSIMASKKIVDILVNNAGITYNALFQATTWDKWHEQFNVNYFGPMLFTQYIIKLMQKNKHGSIVNISSTAALDCNPGRSAYGSSKAAIISTTKAMANELGVNGIRLNCIAPGITNTDMVGQSMSEEVINEVINNTVLKRMGKPSDIAKAAVFLGSDLSSYVTGQVLRVDGGLIKK